MELGEKISQEIKHTINPAQIDQILGRAFEQLSQIERQNGVLVRYVKSNLESIASLKKEVIL